MGTVLGGGAAPVQAASGDREACRGWTGIDGRSVQLDPCYVIPASDPYTIEAHIGVTTHTQWVDPCAQLVDLDTGTWAANYGCIGWVNSGSGYGSVWSQDLTAGKEFGHGHYVVQEGYWWADASGTLHYYDNAQSPVIVF